MDQEQNSTKRRAWKQISEKERYEIEALVTSKQSIRAISRQLHRDRRSIQRELRRGTAQQLSSEYEFYTKYLADVGQRQREKNAANKGRPLKIGKCHELAAYLEKKIVKESYSPDAALGELKKEGANRYDVSICTKTLYNYIVSPSRFNGHQPVRFQHPKRTESANIFWILCYSYLLSVTREKVAPRPLGRPQKPEVETSSAMWSSKKNRPCKG